MTTDFDRAFAVVIGLEGGYVNDPRDPGGETKYGVSKRAYPSVDIAALTIEQAKDLYRHDYWILAGCELMKWPLSLFVFDCAVNQGVGTAKKLLAKAGNRPAEFMALRALRYAQSSNFAIYGKGWFNRLFKIATGL